MLATFKIKCSVVINQLSICSVLALLLMVISCKEKKRQTVQLINNGEVEFEGFRGFQQVIEKHDSFAFFTYGNDSLFYFSNDGVKILAKSYQLLKETTKDFSMLQYCCNDTMFAMDNSNKIIYLVNDSINITQVWQLNNFTEKHTPYRNRLAPYLLNKNYLFMLDNQFDWSNVSEEKNGLVIDMSKTDQEEGFVKKSGLSFPKGYLKKGNGGNLSYIASHAFNKEKKKVIVSFPLDHRLYIYAMKKDSLIFEKKIEAKSQYIDQFRLINESSADNDMQREIQFYQTSPYYLGIQYDSIRKLYYRSVYHEQPLTYPNGKLRMRYDTTSSLIILNTNFEILDEFVIEPRTVDVAPLITKSALLFKKSSYENLSQYVVYDLQVD